MATSALGQTSSGKPLDIYSAALVHAVDEMDQRWSGYQPYGDELPFDFKRPAVAKDLSVLAAYPMTSGERTYEYLTNAQLLTRRKQLGKGFRVLRVNPATVDGPRVKVIVSYDHITVFRGKLFRRKLVQQISDWGIVYFRLDTASAEFQVDEVVLGGI